MEIDYKAIGQRIKDSTNQERHNTGSRRRPYRYYPSPHEQRGNRENESQPADTD